MIERYFSAEQIEGSTATLTGSEAHHLLHVRRAETGQRIVVFDGHGGEFQAELTRCGRAEVELSVGPREAVERELGFELVLAVPLPKGDRQRWLVEKAVELGVTRLVPLKTARSVCDEASSKLRRYVIEASKQCGRNRLMEICPARPWSETVGERKQRSLMAHPGGEPIAAHDFVARLDTQLAVGPEGGFTEEEVALALETGWSVVDLGNRILRIETAAVALVSAVALS